MSSSTYLTDTPIYNLFIFYNNTTFVEPTIISTNACLLEWEEKLGFPRVVFRLIIFLTSSDGSAFGGAAVRRIIEVLRQS